MNPDLHYEAFKEYVGHIDDYLGEDISESDTRAKFIDVWLKECLGWDEKCIRRELTYWQDDHRAAIDYVLSIVQRFLVVEAKRLLDVFELPDNTRRSLYTLDGVVQTCPTLWGAIKQARAYCDDKGIPYALVTNGRQFALFRAITTGTGWTQGKVFVFDIDTLPNRDFKKVFHCLCPETCSATCLDSLLGIQESVSNVGRIAELVRYQAGRLRNKMSDVVEQALAAILRDQPDPDEAFLRECYTLDEPAKFYASSLEALLRDPLPMFAPQSQKVRPASDKDPFRTALTATLSRSGLKPPILLIGGPGTGKTTFLQWFFQVGQAGKVLQDTVILWVDFRKEGYEARDVAVRLRKRLIQLLEEHELLGLDNFNAYQAVFYDRIRRAQKTTLAPFLSDKTAFEKKIADLIATWQSDLDDYLALLLRYAIAHSHKKVLIVLDNADQKTEGFQYEVYDLAQQIANSQPVAVILSLRESTFFKASQSPRLNAFSQQQVFHIQAPRLSPVLTNRFRYLAELLHKEKLTITSAAGYTLDVEDITKFLGLLEKSILEGRQSDKILELLETVSNGSVREALNLIYEFLVSGHTKMDEYFWNYTKDETSRIPFHEFLASVMLDEMGFFTESNSHFFVNIFARQAGIGDSHFTRLRILASVQNLSPGKSLRPEDYVPIDDLRKPFVDTGMSQTTLDRHLKTLLRFGLLVADTQATEEKEFDKAKAIHITASGKFYLDTLSRDLEYCRRLIPDTTVFDRHVYERLQAIYTPHLADNLEISLEQSLSAVELFVRYLEDQEREECQGGPISRNPLMSKMRFAPDLVTAVLGEVSRIRKTMEHS